MTKAAFDNNKYLQMQSAHIRERIAQFGGKLYLEFGGKLYDDNHASRVLPGFQPDSVCPRHLIVPVEPDRNIENHGASVTIWTRLNTIPMC